MLGYKKILWSSVLAVCAMIYAYIQFTTWWAVTTQDAIPDHWETAFFYYFIVSIILAVFTIKATVGWVKWNRKRYNEQYELEVNNFLFNFMPLLSEKLKRHNDFKDFKDLLTLATNIHKDAKELHVLIREVKPHVS